MQRLTISVDDAPLSAQLGDRVSHVVEIYRSVALDHT